MWEESWKITPPPTFRLRFGKTPAFFVPRLLFSPFVFCGLTAAHGTAEALRPAAPGDQVFISDSCLQRRVEVEVVLGGGGLARPLPEVRHEKVIPGDREAT